MIREFNETMAVLYVDYYNKHGQEVAYDFVLKTKVALSVLCSLYDSFIKDGIYELGKLPQETKQRFWNIGCRYFTEMADRIKASKAIYVIHLITANE